MHRRQLLEQWVERLSAFLWLSAKEIGRIGGGQKKPIGKDVLLQENNYFVLRFLAADVGANIDHVLGTIVRTLANR